MAKKKTTPKPASLADLIPDKENPNRHTERGTYMLRQSLETVGAARSIVVDSKNRILAGNGTTEAFGDVYGPDAQIEVVETKGEKLVVVKRMDLDLEDDPEHVARQLTIIDNRSAEVGIDLDPVMLLEFADRGVEMEKMYYEDELAEVLQQALDAGNSDEVGDVVEVPESAAEKLKRKWKTKPGQLWALGDHRVLCGSSAVEEDVKRLLGDAKVSMVFSDPPYGVDMGQEGLQAMLLKSFALTKKHISKGCAVYVTSPQGGDLGLLMMMMMEAGLEVRHVLMWVKNSPTFSMGRLDYEYQHEPIFYTWKGSHKFYGNGTHKTSTWFVDKPREAKLHPTMKPIELIENALLNSSLPGHAVYDPFLGSGSTLVACEVLGRVGYGMEIDPKYVAVILERWHEQTGKMPELL